MLKTMLTGLIAAATFALAPTFVSAQSVVVGGKNNTEQLIMAEITSQLLTARDFKVDLRTGLGSAPLRQAHESGQVDLYWEYTGTSLTLYNKVTEKLSAAATYAKVKELDGAKGIVWLNPSRANNTYALAMRRADAESKNIKTLSDLARKIKAGEIFKFGCNVEFYGRPDGLIPLQQAYGFEFGRDNVVRMDTGLVYQGLRDKQFDVGLVFATDGRIPAFDFVMLADDKGFFPDYAMTAVIRKATLDKHPRLADLLNGIAANLDDATMAKLNASVDVDKKTVKDVAAGFLKMHKLI